MVNIDPLLLAMVSAAGGALVSSVGTFIAQELERRHKRKEIVFNAAIEQAQRRVSTSIEIAKLSGQSTVVEDEAILTGAYYEWLAHLFDKGTMPESAKEAEKTSKLALEEAEKRRTEQIRLHNERLISEAECHPLAARQLLANTTDFAAFSEEQYQRLQAAAAQQYP